MSISKTRIGFLSLVFFLITISSLLVISYANYNSNSDGKVSSTEGLLQSVPHQFSMNVPQNSGQKGKPSTWNQYISNNHLPGTGCYQVNNMSSSWEKVQCHNGTPRPLAPKIVGDGYDPVLNASNGAIIGSSTGTFVNVTGVVNETDSIAGPGEYTLQDNTNTFTTNTTYTSKSADGWEQFVYDSNDSSGPSADPGNLFIQYWLLGYGSRCTGTETPPGGSGWYEYEDDCYANSPMIPVPFVAPSNLGQVTFIGTANSTTDAAYLCITGGGCSAMAITDGVLNLSKSWQWSEFNVFGYNDGSEAEFNSGSSLTVVNTLNVPTGCIPASAGDGETAEYNNLILTTPCATSGDEAYFTENAIPPSVSIAPLSGTVDSDGLTDATFTATASGGSGSYSSYNWSIPPELSPYSGCTIYDSTCAVTSTDDSGSPYTLSVTVTDTDGLTSNSSSASVVVNPVLVGPSIQANPSSISPGGSSEISTTSSFSGGTSPYYCLWYGASPGTDNFDPFSSLFACTPSSVTPVSTGPLSTEGNWTFELGIYDSVGGYATSTPVNVTVGSVTTTSSSSTSTMTTTVGTTSISTTTTTPPGTTASSTSTSTTTATTTITITTTSTVSTTSTAATSTTVTTPVTSTSTVTETSTTTVPVSSTTTTTTTFVQTSSTTSTATVPVTETTTAYSPTDIVTQSASTTSVTTIPTTVTTTSTVPTTTTSIVTTITPSTTVTSTAFTTSTSIFSTTQPTTTTINNGGTTTVSTTLTTTPVTTTSVLSTTTRVGTITKTITKTKTVTTTVHFHWSPVGQSNESVATVSSSGAGSPVPIVLAALIVMGALVSSRFISFGSLFSSVSFKSAFRQMARRKRSVMGSIAMFVVLVLAVGAASAPVIFFSAANLGPAIAGPTSTSIATATVTATFSTTSTQTFTATTTIPATTTQVTGTRVTGTVPVTTTATVDSTTVTTVPKTTTSTSTTTTTVPTTVTTTSTGTVTSTASTTITARSTVTSTAKSDTTSTAPTNTATQTTTATSYTGSTTTIPVTVTATGGGSTTVTTTVVSTAPTSRATVSGTRTAFSLTTVTQTRTRTVTKTVPGRRFNSPAGNSSDASVISHSSMIGSLISSLPVGLVSLLGIGGVALMRTDANGTREKTRAAYSYIRNWIS